MAKEAAVRVRLASQPLSPDQSTRINEPGIEEMVANGSTFVTLKPEVEFLITLEPRGECYKSLCALNTNPTFPDTVWARWFPLTLQTKPSRMSDGWPRKALVGAFQVRSWSHWYGPLTLTLNRGLRRWWRTARRTSRRVPYIPNPEPQTLNPET